MYIIFEMTDTKIALKIYIHRYTIIVFFSFTFFQTVEIFSMHKYVYSWMNDFHGIESINLDKYYLVVISVNFIRPKIQLKQNTTALEEQFDESMMKFKGIWENYPFFEMITYEKCLKGLSFEK